MKKILLVTFGLSMMSFLFMIFFFLASTDIYHDYVSKTFASRGIISNAENLPEWTNCNLEWHVLQIDFLIRIVFMILIIVVLIKVIKDCYKDDPVAN